MKLEKNNYHTKCLISNKDDLVPLKGYESKALVKSKSIGFVFCSKIPTSSELEDYYSNYPIGYGADSDSNKKRINERLDEFELFRTTNRILDVGCGPGLFLIEAKKRGWECYGTEFTDKQVNHLNDLGIKPLKGKLQGNSFTLGYFDVIISSEVIEHIYNPLEEVHYFRTFLRKGGLLYITTPNFNCIERYLLKTKYDIIAYPEHLCYYTAKTIDYLLRNNGFKKHRITTTGISPARIKNSKRKDVVNGKNDSTYNDENLRNSMESGVRRYFKNFINYVLNIFKIGNSLKAWYIKNK